MLLIAQDNVGIGTALRPGYFQSSAYSAPHVVYDSFAINQQDVPCLVLVETTSRCVQAHNQELTLSSDGAETCGYDRTCHTQVDVCALM